MAASKIAITIDDNTPMYSMKDQVLSLLWRSPASHKGQAKLSVDHGTYGQGVLNNWLAVLSQIQHIKREGK